MKTADACQGDAGTRIDSPHLAGHGPTLVAGLSERLELNLVGRQEFPAGRSLCITSPVESQLEGSAATGHTGLATPPQRQGRDRRALERRVPGRLQWGDVA